MDAAIAQIKPLYLDGEQFLDSANKQVAGFGQVSSCKHLDVLPASIYQAEVVVIKVLAQQVQFFSCRTLRLQHIQWRLLCHRRSLLSLKT